MPRIKSGVTLLAGAVAIATALAANAQTSGLCVNGYPAQRNTHVTYGGLPPKYGYQRDHRVPLCLGGPDTADNVQYQPLAEAGDKDKVEWYACEGYCAGRITLSQALEMVHDWRSER